LGNNIVIRNKQANAFLPLLMTRDVREIWVRVCVRDIIR